MVEFKNRAMMRDGSVTGGDNDLSVLAKIVTETMLRTYGCHLLLRQAQALYERGLRWVQTQASPKPWRSAQVPGGSLLYQGLAEVRTVSVSVMRAAPVSATSPRKGVLATAVRCKDSADKARENELGFSEGISGRQFTPFDSGAPDLGVYVNKKGKYLYVFPRNGRTMWRLGYRGSAIEQEREQIYRESGIDPDLGGATCEDQGYTGAGINVAVLDSLGQGVNETTVFVGHHIHVDASVDAGHHCLIIFVRNLIDAPPVRDHKALKAQFAPE